MKKPRAGSTWFYDPVLMDQIDPPHGRPAPGDRLKVVRLNGCPPPGTMGMCHVNFADTGEFAGLVCVNSLSKIPVEREEPEPPQHYEMPTYKDHVDLKLRTEG